MFAGAAKNTSLPSLESIRWCNRSQILLPKFPHMWITKIFWDQDLCYMSLFSSHFWLPYSFAPPSSFRQEHLLEQCFAPDHTLTSSLAFCLCVSYRQKNLNAFLLTVCTCWKSQCMELWSYSLLNFCFTVVTMAFCPSGLFKATENKVNVLQGTMVLQFKKKNKKKGGGIKMTNKSFQLSIMHKHSYLS